MNSEGSIAWPRNAVPTIRNGGRFPMAAHDSEIQYFTPQTTALHLHDYAGRMWIGRRLITLKPGDFTLTPAGVTSRYDLDVPGEHRCMHVESVETAGEVLEVPLHWRPGGYGHRLREQMQGIIDLRRRAEGDSSGVARLASGVALQSLLLWLVVMKGQAPGARTSDPMADKMDQVRHYLDEHFRDKLSLPELSRRFEVSQNYLARCFRERHGMTIQRYQLDRRVELARHLLTMTRIPIKAVAIEVGLGNPQYFHRQFSRVTGHSPSEEREEAKVTG